MLQDPFGVAVGGTLGHCLCTGLAVIGGRMVAQKISVRTGETESFSTVHHVGLHKHWHVSRFICWYFLLLSLQLQSLVESFSLPLRSLHSSSSPILDSDGRTDSWFHFVYIQPRTSGTERERLRKDCRWLVYMFEWVSFVWVKYDWMNEWMKNYLLLMSVSVFCLIPNYLSFFTFNQTLFFF